MTTGCPSDPLGVQARERFVGGSLQDGFHELPEGERPRSGGSDADCFRDVIVNQNLGERIEKGLRDRGKAGLFPESREAGLEVEAFGEFFEPWGAGLLEVLDGRREDQMVGRAGEGDIEEPERFRLFFAFLAGEVETHAGVDRFSPVSGGESDERSEFGIEEGFGAARGTDAFHVGEDDNGEFEAFGLMNGHQTDNVAGFRVGGGEFLIGFLEDGGVQLIDKFTEAEESDLIELAGHFEEFLKVGEFTFSEEFEE